MSRNRNEMDEHCRGGAYHGSGDGFQEMGRSRAPARCLGTEFWRGPGPEPLGRDWGPVQGIQVGFLVNRVVLNFEVRNVFVSM